MKPAISIIATDLISLTGIVTAEESNLPPTQEEQQELTPDAVRSDLSVGNQRYRGERPRRPFNAAERRAASAEGQFPKAMVLSCLDSRVPVEQILDQGIGDLFVARVAGNVEDVDLLGSMEFAVASGVKIVMVLGHSDCGAVKGAIDMAHSHGDPRLPANLENLLAKIVPAVRAVSVPEPRTSENPRFVAKVVRENVLGTMARIKEKSAFLDKAAREGKIEFVGAIYDLETGRIDPLNTEDGV